MLKHYRIYLKSISIYELNLMKQYFENNNAYNIRDTINDALNEIQNSPTLHTNTINKILNVINNHMLNANTNIVSEYMCRVILV